MSTLTEMVEGLRVCGTCRKALHFLPPGHALHCAALADERRRRSMRARAVVVLLLVALFATAARAQGLDPAAVQAGFERNALATIAAVELLAIAYLFWSLQKSQEARFADLTRSYEAAMKLQESGVKLSIQALEAVEVVEHIVERMPPRSA